MKTDLVFRFYVDFISIRKFFIYKVDETLWKNNAKTLLEIDSYTSIWWYLVIKIY